MVAIIPGPHVDPIPRSDEGLAAFGDVFAGAWAPATFNVVLPLAATLTALSTAFAAALAVASDPATRTTPAVAAKNVARTNLEVALRSAIRSAQAAYLAGTASEEALNELGVRANSLIRTPISGPEFPPILGLDTAAVGSVNLRVTQVDQLTGSAVSTRAYSYGISGIELQRKVGAGDWDSMGLRKLVRINDATGGLTPGSLLQYRARYQTAKGLVSPWCAIVNGVVM